MKDIQYFIIAGSLLLITAIGKALEKYRKKEIKSTIDVMSSLVFSIIGGSIAGMIASVYIETVQLQWIMIAGGAWMGERVLDAVAAALESKIDLIFKRKKDE
jgi:hypothetical protein